VATWCPLAPPGATWCPYKLLIVVGKPWTVLLKIDMVPITDSWYFSDAFSRDDMVKIWKGLHYCMWMSDKPLVQEDLADLISSLIHNMKTPGAAFMFLDTFFETESREWYGIDRLRIDKFMMVSTNKQSFI
jgi:hypothetical protein